MENLFHDTYFVYVFIVLLYIERTFDIHALFSFLINWIQCIYLFIYCIFDSYGFFYYCGYKYSYRSYFDFF